MSVARKTGEPQGGAGGLAPDELASEDKSASTEIAKADVKAQDELEYEDNSATTMIVKTDVEASDEIISKEKWPSR